MNEKNETDIPQTHSNQFNTHYKPQPTGYTPFLDELRKLVSVTQSAFVAATFKDYQ